MKISHISIALLVASSMVPAGAAFAQQNNAVPSVNMQGNAQGNTQAGAANTGVAGTTNRVAPRITFPNSNGTAGATAAANGGVANGAATGNVAGTSGMNGNGANGDTDVANGNNGVGAGAGVHVGGVGASVGANAGSNGVGVGANIGGTGNGAAASAGANGAGAGTAANASTSNETTGAVNANQAAKLGVPQGTIHGRKITGLIGASVINANNTQIGTIKNFVVDRKNLTYAVIGLGGGFFGIGGHKIAIPVSKLTLQGNPVVVSTNMTKQQLLKLPEYKATNYSNYNGG